MGWLGWVSEHWFGELGVVRGVGGEASYVLLLHLPYWGGLLPSPPPYPLLTSLSTSTKDCLSAVHSATALCISLLE